MTREYFVRGQRETVDEVDNIVAVKVRSDERGAPVAEPRAFGTAFPIPAAAGVIDDAYQAFAQARWVFVQPSPEIPRAIGARETMPGVEEIGKLVRRPNGRVGIVTRRLN